MSEQTNHRGPSEAKAWRERNRKLVTLPSGLSVIIRRLTAEFLLVMKELFETMLIADERGVKARLTVDQNRQYIEALICETVIAPKVVRRTQEPKDNELQVDDFGSDLDPLVAVINTYNEEVLVTPFRAAANEPAAAPVGGDVQGAPEQPAEGAAA